MNQSRLSIIENTMIDQMKRCIWCEIKL